LLVSNDNFLEEQLKNDNFKKSTFPSSEESDSEEDLYKSSESDL